MSEQQTPREDGRVEDRAGRFSRRAILRAALGAAGVAALAACGGTEATPAAGTTPAVTATTVGAARAATVTAGRGATGASPVAIDGKIPSPAPGVPDAYTKLPPTFRAVAAVPGRGGRVTTFLITGLPPVPARAENAYWQELEKRLGATMDYTIVATSAYQEKLAASTAAGDLADLTAVLVGNAPDHARVVQQGAYTDLTPYLTGDALNDYPNLAAFPPQIWQNVAIRRKIYGVPRPRFLTTDTLVVRQDWAEKVGQPEPPKNAEEFARLMTAFTRNDPDGNDRPDTFGPGTYAQATFALSFFQNIYRVANEWQLQAGRLTYYLETEEFRGAIAYARRLFEAGVYYPDTVNMTQEQGRTTWNGGKYGATFDSITGIPGRRVGPKAIVPTANVVGLAPFGHDGGQGVTNNTAGFLGFLAIPAKVGRDRERVRELLRILDWYAAPFGSEEWVFKNYGLEGVHHERKPDGTRVRTERGTQEIGALSALMNDPQTFYYPNDPSLAEYLQGYVRGLLAIGIDNPTQTAYSQTATAKAGELDQLRVDRAIAIITGREPLSALDAWIRDWRSRGGDQIRKEYEDDLNA